MRWCIDILSVLVFTQLTSLFPVFTFGDRIVPGESLTPNQTIVSAGATFALGFFTPGNSSQSYVGIWYNNISQQTVIWVANREYPLAQNPKNSFTVGSDGNFVVLDGEGNAVWSSNVSTSNFADNSTVGTLLDSGNLVLGVDNDENIFGYMSPEYALDGQFSEKSDIFSFGVLLIEIVSGRRNIGFYRPEICQTLLGRAWELWNGGRVLELLDPSIRDTCSSDEVSRCVHVGLLCVQDSPIDRPSMSSIIFMLGSDSMSLPSAKEPLFATQRTRKDAGSSSTYSSASKNEMTITLLESR
ncbi:Bulb-type lectin domain [Dillenia turbinata]|uniref:Bulb-type lectin domain n=1 Tax=Dillenia turbinata TaxID=194707 RepID=A0AAN8Z340_9MAGN